MTGKSWIIGVCMVLSICNGPKYQGPVSDHFDGKHFSAPEPLPPKSWLDVWKWRLTARRMPWPQWVNITPDKPPAQVEGSQLRVSFVNHATFLLQTEGLNILTDPIWSDRASPLSFIGPKRVTAPGIVWNDLPKIDLVLISHSHYDHLDIPTLKKLVARDNPQIIVPLGVDTIIRNHMPQAKVQAMDWGQEDDFSGIAIHAEPTYHWSARSFWDRNETLWASYVIATPHGKIYFSGDTGYASGKVFREIGKKYGSIRFAMIGIGAYEPRWFMKPSHINPDEAVQVFQDIRAQHAVPMHWGTFQLSDEGRDQPVQDLYKALDTAKIPRQKFQALDPGQFIELK